MSHSERETVLPKNGSAGGETVKRFTNFVSALMTSRKFGLIVELVTVFWIYLVYLVLLEFGVLLYI
jgi:hypothetical protein